MAYLDVLYSVALKVMWWWNLLRPNKVQRDPVVVEAEPEGIFDQAAMDAVLKFKYKPRADGEAVEVDGVRNRMTFNNRLGDL